MRDDEMITVETELEFHFENVPRGIRQWMMDEFVKYRNEVTKVFNGLIDVVNNEWEQTGKPTMLVEGSCDLNDVNPEYHELIRARIQPHIDEINKHVPYCKYRLDEYGSITGYLPFIKNSKISMTILDMKKKES